MVDTSRREEAVELLQQLGLKEYEAKCFVALTRVSQATAKEVSEVSEVPRTRVYDAIRVLESEGLVEVQHTSPQQFRAIDLDEAVEALRAQYESRVSALEEALSALEPTSPAADEVDHEVWSLTGLTAIENRVRSLVGGADNDVVLVVGASELVDDSLLDALNAATARGVAVRVGVLSEELRDAVSDAVPDANVFVSGLGWVIRPKAEMFDGAVSTSIGHLLLVDRDTILVSTVSGASAHAVFGAGLDNGFVVVTRRLLAAARADVGADEAT